MNHNHTTNGYYGKLCLEDFICWSVLALRCGTVKKWVNFSSARTRSNSGVLTLTLPAHPLLATTSRGWLGLCFFAVASFKFLDIWDIHDTLNIHGSRWFKLLPIYREFMTNLQLKLFLPSFQLWRLGFWPMGIDDAAISRCAARWMPGWIAQLTSALE